MGGIVYPTGGDTSTAATTSGEESIYSHQQNLGDVVVKSGTNMILANPVTFESLTIEDGALLIILI